MSESKNRGPFDALNEIEDYMNVAGEDEIAVMGVVIVTKNSVEYDGMTTHGLSIRSTQDGLDGYDNVYHVHAILQEFDDQISQMRFGEDRESEPNSLEALLGL